MVRSALATQGARAQHRARAPALDYIPAITVVVGSLIALLPIVSATGWWPDLGPADAARPGGCCAPTPGRPGGRPRSGFVNDLIAGNPIGLSVALWAAIMLAMDILDRRTMWRDYWIEWAHRRAVHRPCRDRPVAGRGAGRRAGAASPRVAPAILVGDPVLPGRRLPRRAARPLEAGPMKASRFTSAHQSITFSRRMMLVGGAQAAFGGALVARLGYLSVAQNEHYQLLSAKATASS